LGEGQNDRLPALAADLVRRPVTVIATVGPPPVFAAKTATSTIPIVFVVGIDPVQAGFVASLARPGTNIICVALTSADLAAKRLELIHKLVPTASLQTILAQRLFPEPVAGCTFTGRSCSLPPHPIERGAWKPSLPCEARR
jgi:putative ABC transport system substrate-binding protein